MADLNALKSANAQRWRNVKLTRNFTAVAKHLVDPTAKRRYQAVFARTGVPWWFIAVAHEREASQRWDTQLGQGDPLTSISVHVPKGRGPFSTWEAGAYDALVNCAPWAARNKDWSIGGTLTMLEQYNGLGYASGPTTKHEDGTVTHYPPQASPYIWSGTSAYSSGKYVRDHVFDPNVTDVQMGCAGLLIAMMALDPTITFTGATITPINQLAPKEPTSTPKKAGGSIAAGGAAATAAHQSGLSVGWIVGIGVAVAVAAFLIWKLKWNT